MYLVVIEKNSSSSFRLDFLYCTPGPGFSNRAISKRTSVEIKLVIDPNIHLIIKKEIRGGRCYPIYYHAKANNKYINPNFVKKRDKESYIISLDTKSLYSTAMCYKLPYKVPKFDDDISKYTINYILNLDPYGDYCYIFNVDIHYPSKLHDRDNESPILSEPCIPPNDQTKKVMSTLYDKKNTPYLL